MFVYVLAWDDKGPSKIGFAADPKKRLRTLQTGSPHTLQLKHVEPVGTAAATIEREVHRALAGRRLACGIRGIADRIPTQAGQRSDDCGQPVMTG